MTLTSSFCRTQEASERARATNARLDNVKAVATMAALAWAREAVLAEKRETRRALHESLPEAGSASETLEDQLVNENPDRGTAIQRSIA